MKKTVSIVLVCAFFWTMQLTAAPLASPGGNPATGTEDGAGAVEKAVVKPEPSKKSPLVPILIGVAAAAAIVLAVLLATSKSDATYDITGNWSVNMVRSFDNSQWQAAFNFSGEKGSGDALYTDPWLTSEGTYSVSGTSVSVNFISVGGGFFTFSGSIADSNAMNGTWSADDLTGTWSAAKGSASAAFPKKPGAKTGTLSPLLGK